MSTGADDHLTLNRSSPIANECNNNVSNNVGQLTLVFYINIIILNRISKSCYAD